MKQGISKHIRFTLTAVSALLALIPAAQADWGSVRANNREVRRPEPEQVRREAERRRWDIEAERRNAFFWAGFHPGMVTAALPAGFLQLSVGSNGYYYYDGIYYQTGPSGYTVVAPPVGAIVPQLPEGAQTISMGMVTYYYAAGAFYMRQLTGFAVVPAPLGVTVAGPPPGAVPVTINGSTYYQSGATYFTPVMQAGATAYVTTNP